MLQSKEKVIELGKQLPWGAKREISRRTGFAAITVTKFFKGSNSRYDIAVKLIKEANKLIKEYNEELIN